MNFRLHLKNEKEMKNRTNGFNLLSFLIILSIVSVSVKAQSVIGLWEIKEVTMGDQAMTPVAKWTQIEADGTYSSGNGWLQNSEGNWTFDKETNQFLPNETNGLKDPFGAFTVSFKGTDKMEWTREEEGMRVKVALARTDQKPKAPADKLVGLWDLIEARKGEESTIKRLDPNDQHFIFFRWDRIYRERTPAGERTSGYWHINGHRPEITLLSHQDGKVPESWRISVDANRLQMEGISDSNRAEIRILKRLDEFPQ
jgi:hypothetical protein